MFNSEGALMILATELVIPPDYNNPILVTRPGSSKKLEAIYLGKKFDWWNPFAMFMLIVLLALFFAGAVLITTGLWYLGVALLAVAICLFLTIPVSRRKNLKGDS